jgi:hypothetical protein
MSIAPPIDGGLFDDRTTKQRLYAAAGIPVYWIVNLADRRIEVCTAPTGAAVEAGYRNLRRYSPPAAVPLDLGGTEVGPLAVEDLLP